jgi:hypothetical protein
MRLTTNYLTERPVRNVRQHKAMTPISRRTKEK